MAPQLQSHRAMSLHSNAAPEYVGQVPEPGVLAQAFASFCEAAGVLQGSYRDLQQEVARLRAQAEIANEKLRLSLQRNERMRAYLERILHGLPCGVLVIDSEGRCRILNPAAHELFPGLEPGKPVSETALEAIVCGPEWSNGAEHEVTLTNGNDSRTIACSRVALASPDQDGAEIVFLLRDVSLERKLQQENESARRRLALAEITAVLAHEIRNPLASMELTTNLLVDLVGPSGEALSWVYQLQAGLRMLSATVNNVLRFHGGSSGERKPIEAGGLLREAAEFLHPLAHFHGVQLRYANNVEDAKICAAPHQIQQVFFNLAMNAFSAMKNGGVLAISAEWERTGATLRIDFRDNGTGIEAGKLEAVFQPGYSTKGGTGLGLAVCKSIVEDHGGTIRVQSTPGAGSTFSILLNVARGN